ncbi:LysM peptidoglycan-binding domain-containing protein [Alteribacillus bidgolensis]|uniref:LysM domain-containing protein n=1 Tax=Alteribacillus bidgolensis TaxID=930129 RepID=A0A1G8I447_9BACI|nr:LysM peptidoglycan-binding domain-containing protein [Alteribacillus bidgolensis]SDI13521.1 LysM domain-containing protein [Alteribacillus bidgolensis]
MAIVRRGTYFVYTIQSGDTLYSIANRLGSNVSDITLINVLYPPFTDPGLIFSGQRIIVPYPYNPRSQVVYFVQPGDTLQSIGRSFVMPVNQLIEANPQIESPELLQAFDMVEIPARVYVVESGDSLASISRKLDVSAQTIIAMNQGRTGFSPDVIYSGYGLLVP